MTKSKIQNAKRIVNWHVRFIGNLFFGACSFLLSISALNAQSADTSKPYQSFVKKIVATGLGDDKAIEFLQQLSGGIGPRLSGSANADSAIVWAKKTLTDLGFDNVHTEPVMVPHWVRGSIEKCWVENAGSNDKQNLTIATLGGSVATDKGGITAEVVEVHNFDELKALGAGAKGKIVFFNRPFDRSLYHTFEQYGGAVNQRGQGASEAARQGGIAALVRTMSSRIDDVPHTGAMHYNDSLPKVPTVAVSTLGADHLSALLKQYPHLKVHLEIDPQTLPDVQQANTIAEITGTEHPEQVVVIGGHLDSWDKGRGAHDDGAGIAHCIEALRLLKELGLRPKRTIRLVCFINEENGARGGAAYAAKDRPGEKAIAAIETDEGGFQPRGFGISTDSLTFDKIAKWAYLFTPIEADRLVKGGGGTDIEPLAKQNVPQIGLEVGDQRYFDYHHSNSDTIDKVNERELELGAICVAILSYVLANEGV
jgi:hypothetical protein